MISADVADEQAVEKAFAKIRAIDILVNNAGIVVRKNALDIPREDWDRVIAVNLTRALALEFAGHRIRVNAVAPTFVRTGVTLPVDSGYLAR